VLACQPRLLTLCAPFALNGANAAEHRFLLLSLFVSPRVQFSCDVCCHLKVGGSIPPSLKVFGGIAQSGERQTEVSDGSGY
jgi:hypothetical protein